MDKQLSLKDGTQVCVRPMNELDFDRSFVFFQDLPAEDRRYLRVDVTKPENVRRRIEDIRRGRVQRLVACVADDIVADGALEMSAHEWSAHVAELRLIVARRYQRLGLGMLMARELYLLAASHRVEVIQVCMMRPQVAAVRIFSRLGFHEDSTMPAHLKDAGGARQDMIVMRCDLESMMQELSAYFAASDWQRVR